MRGQSAEMVFNGFAGDMLAAVVAQYVQGQDFGGGARIEHAHSFPRIFHAGWAPSLIQALTFGYAGARYWD